MHSQINQHLFCQAFFQISSNFYKKSSTKPSVFQKKICNSSISSTPKIILPMKTHVPAMSQWCRRLRLSIRQELSTTGKSDNHFLWSRCGGGQVSQVQRPFLECFCRCCFFGEQKIPPIWKIKKMYLPQPGSTLFETTTYSSHGYHGCLLTLLQMYLHSCCTWHVDRLYWDGKFSTSTPGNFASVLPQTGPVQTSKNHQTTKRTECFQTRHLRILLRKHP